MKPSIVCDSALSDRPNCSCTCTNGITFDQALDPFSSSTNGTPDDSVCQADKTECFERERQLKIENASLIKAQQDQDERERQLMIENASLTKAQQDHTGREQALMDMNALLTKGEQDIAAREQALLKQLATYQNKPTYTYQGCFTDSANRVLNDKTTVDANITVERCESTCRGYKYFGVQFNHCFCGQSFVQPTQHRDDKECHVECTGDKTQKCGGGWRNSLYSRNG